MYTFSVAKGLTIAPKLNLDANQQIAAEEAEDLVSYHIEVENIKFDSTLHALLSIPQDKRPLMDCIKDNNRIDLNQFITEQVLAIALDLPDDKQQHISTLLNRRVL